MSENLVNMVSERYGYHAGLLRARAELRASRIEAGEPQLKSERQKLRRKTADLYRRANSMTAKTIKSTIKEIVDLDEKVIAMKKDIATLTEPQRERVKRFTEIVDHCDELVIAELQELGLYKELELPEERALTVVAEAVEAVEA